MSGSAGAIIAVEGVTRRFRRGAETVVALENVSLEIFTGEVTVAAGPSGSGKTTLLSVVAGLEKPDSGTVRTFDPLPPDVPTSSLAWRHLAFVPQALALLDELTVRENVDLPAVLDRTAAGSEDLLEKLEIAHLADRYPSHTSGGEQQRTALGRALRLRPVLLVGDEPTGHQDRGRVALVLNILRQHAYSGAAVLISSHDEAVISAADRVVTLADGRIVEDYRARSTRYAR